MLSVPDIMIAYQRTPGPAGGSRCAARAGRDDRPVRELEGSLRHPRRAADEGRRRGAQVAAAAELVVRGACTTRGSRSTPAGAVLSMCPPSGHVAGVIARCDTQEGVHKAPANEVITGAVGLMLNMNEDHLGLLNSDGINAVRGFPGRGIRVWGARTTSDEPDWRYINVRRTFIMLRRSLEEGTQWSVFEPNEPRTWERLTQSVDEFLKKLWADGYFAGATPEESYFVKCDETTNTSETRAGGSDVDRDRRRAGDSDRIHHLQRRAEDVRARGAGGVNDGRRTTTAAATTRASGTRRSAPTTFASTCTSLAAAMVMGSYPIPQLLGGLKSESCGHRARGGRLQRHDAQADRAHEVPEHRAEARAVHAELRRCGSCASRT